MKKMERIDDKLFRPLTAGEQKRITAGRTTQTPNTISETTNSDFLRDGDNE